MTNFQYTAFSQRGRGKLHNEDAVSLDDQVYQGNIRGHRVVDTSQPRYFAIADGGCHRGVAALGQPAFAGNFARASCIGICYGIIVVVAASSAARLCGAQ